MTCYLRRTYLSFIKQWNVFLKLTFYISKKLGTLVKISIFVITVKKFTVYMLLEHFFWSKKVVTLATCVFKNNVTILATMCMFILVNMLVNLLINLLKYLVNIGMFK